MVKKMILLPVIILIVFNFFSCKKDNTAVRSAASLTIVNAVAGSEPLVTNFSDDYSLAYYKAAGKLYYGSYNQNSNQFSSYVGETHLRLYQYPDTTEHSSPLFSFKLSLLNGGIYSLFLTGAIVAPDTLFIQDYPPYHSSSDSVLGVRFVNLSSGSGPVNITLASTPDVNEFGNVSYKGVTSFKNYPAINAVSSYTFQFRDPVTNDVLGSIKMNGINNGTGTNTTANNYRFRNFTIALIGQPGSQQAMLINNY